MKRLIFTKVTDEVTGNEKLEAVVKKINGINTDGSTIRINDSLLDEALKNSLAERKQFGRGINTIFYKFNDITLVRIQKDKAIVVDSEIFSNEWIADTLKGKGISVKRKTGVNKERGICRISMAKVKHLTADRKDVKETMNYPVSLSLVLWDLKLGNISSVNLQENEIYDVVNMESHHEKATWDNRLESTVRLTSKDHKDYHSVNGSESHDMNCTITSLEELQAFLEYVRNN